MRNWRNILLAIFCISIGTGLALYWYGGSGNLEYLCSVAGKIKSDPRYGPCSDRASKGCFWIVDEIASAVWDPRLKKVFAQTAAVSGDVKCKILTAGFQDVASSDWECPDLTDILCGNNGQP